ncbi:MAG: hypothetical protein JWN22_3327 [Nocardioides sp.]|jgi:hypothetical protein|nr:hypothetical protein [Nocardioides sp.]
MNLRRSVPLILLGLVLLVSMFTTLRPSPSSSAPGTAPAAAPAAATAAPAGQPKVVYFSLSDVKVRPKKIFTAYNSSPYLKRLHWTKWGGQKAVATGIYMSDCASCYGPDRRDAVVTLSRLVTCKNVDYRTYRKARVKVSEPDEGFTDTTYKLPTGCGLYVPH